MCVRLVRYLVRTVLVLRSRVRVELGSVGLKVSVSVLVPEERLGEFYGLLGRFLAGGDAPAAGARKRKGRAPATSRAGRRSRYAPLTEFLTGASGDATEWLRFEELERVLGSPLPESARVHRAFWANSEHVSQARSWLSAGWVVGALDWDGKRVRFERRAK